MPKPAATGGIARIFRAAGYSAKGISAAWRHEAAFRQESLIVAIMIPAAFWLGQTPLHIVLLIAAALQILMVELLNSAVEAVVDRIGDEHHELAGRAKDMASAAVAVSLLLAAVVWLGYALHRFTG